MALPALLLGTQTTRRCLTAHETTPSPPDCAPEETKPNATSRRQPTTSCAVVGTDPPPTAPVGQRCGSDGVSVTPVGSGSLRAGDEAVSGNRSGRAARATAARRRTPSSSSGCTTAASGHRWGHFLFAPGGKPRLTERTMPHRPRKGVCGVHCLRDRRFESREPDLIGATTDHPCELRVHPEELQPSARRCARGTSVVVVLLRAGRLNARGSRRSNSGERYRRRASAVVEENKSMRRVRVERGIYGEAHGKYAVCLMLDGGRAFAPSATTSSSRGCSDFRSCGRHGLGSKRPRRGCCCGCGCGWKLSPAGGLGATSAGSPPVSGDRGRSRLARERRAINRGLILVRAPARG